MRINEDLAAASDSSYKKAEILNEHSIDKHDLIFVDILLKDSNTVVEIDGPFHFIGGDMT